MNDGFFQKMVAAVLYGSELPLLNQLPDPDWRDAKNFRCTAGRDEFHQVCSNREPKALAGQS
ncbi:MAG: hypothetical protein M9920_04140 [Verrucomicrobiae bacterium]|nr:hypothetical protein [Verrucomicrobiae bacterium]